MLNDVFNGSATFLSVLVVLFVYYAKERNNKRKAARILLLEIRHAEKTIQEIKISGVVSEFTSILPVNSWQSYQHLFIHNLDTDDLEAINNFYNACAISEKEIDRMKQLLPTSNDEKIRLTQRKLLELAEKFRDKRNNLDSDSKYSKEKRAILTDLYYKEEEWFQPALHINRLITYLQTIYPITTSSAGQKIKKIARLK